MVDTSGPDYEDGRADSIPVAGGVAQRVPEPRLHFQPGGSRVYKADWLGAVPSGMPSQLAWKEIPVEDNGPFFREELAYQAIAAGRKEIDDNHTIVRSVGFHQTKEVLYHIMELVGTDSGRLSDSMTDESRRSEFVTRVLTDGYRALTALDVYGVFHRDVHPGNLMSSLESTDGIPDRFMLGDFGHAFVRYGSAGGPASAEAKRPSLIGQESMQSKELIESGQHKGFYDDLFALGMAAYVLAGEKPLMAWRSPEGEYATWSSHRPADSDLAPDIARLCQLEPDIALAIQLMLAPTVTQRIKSAGKISQLLAPRERVISEPSVVHLDITVPEPVNLWPREDEMEELPGLVGLYDFRKRRDVRRRIAFRIPERHRRAAAYVVTAPLPLLLALVSITLPPWGVSWVHDLVGSPDWLQWASMIAVVSGAIAIFAFGLAALRGREWMQGEVLERLRWALIYSLSAIVLLGYLPAGLVALEEWVLRESSFGLDWFLPWWGAPQWLFWAATLSFVLWAVAMGLVPRSARPAMGNLCIVPVLLAVASVFTGLEVVRPFPAAGAQPAADCGTRPFEFTTMTGRLCVSADRDWERLAGKEFSADEFVALREWTETPSLGVTTASPYLVVRSVDHDCLTGYFRVDSGQPEVAQRQISVGTGADTEVELARFDGNGNSRITVRGHVQYLVYGSLAQDRRTVYVASTDGLEGYGTTRVTAQFVAKFCDSAALAAAEQLVRKLMDGVRVSDTGYVDQPFFQRNGNALAALGISVGDLRVPLSDRMSMAIFTEQLSSIVDGSVAAAVPVVLRPEYDEYPWVSILFSATAAEEAAYAEGSIVDGWMEGPASDPGEDGASVKSYFRSFPVTEGFVYVQVRLFAVLESEDGAEFRETVKELLSGIGIVEES